MIKPCPWCGGTEVDRQTQNEDSEGTPVNAVCVTCGACSPWEYTNDPEGNLHLKLWNERNDKDLLEEKLRMQDIIFGLNETILKIQQDCMKYLIPDNDCNGEWLISRVLFHVDNPKMQELKNKIMGDE